MSYIISILVTALAVMIVAYFMPTIEVKNYVNALIFAVLLSLANAFVKPILIFLTIPITILTLGLFILVINALMVLLVARVFDGIKVKDFVSALIFSILLSIVSGGMQWILGLD